RTHYAGASFGADAAHECLRSDRYRFSQRNDHRLIAAIRSSIRSRSTSQNLSDDRTSLSISLVWTDSSSSTMSGGDACICLLNFFDLRLNFDVRHLARFELVASIDDS